MSVMANGKKTFYCVVMQVYAYGAVKTAIKTRSCKQIPANKENSVYGMTAYEDWFLTREEAEAFLAEAEALTAEAVAA